MTGDDIDMTNTGVEEWEISDVLAQWWRPNYESFMVCPCLAGRELKTNPESTSQYPYVPA